MVRLECVVSVEVSRTPRGSRRCVCVRARAVVVYGGSRSNFFNNVIMASDGQSMIGWNKRSHVIKMEMTSVRFPQFLEKMRAFVRSIMEMQFTLERRRIIVASIVPGQRGGGGGMQLLRSFIPPTFASTADAQQGTEKLLN